MARKRRNHYDVTDRVRISHPGDVATAVLGILSSLYPGHDLQPVRRAYDVFARLYAGTLPGYVGCDTWYHDAQHSLDCSLATTRLLDGYERSMKPANRLGASRGLLGVIIALFHDAGYIRREDDGARNGAEYTLSHVRRSGEFLADFLPTVGYADHVALTRQVVHFTGYEIALDQIKVGHPKDRMLGFILGTADILAQTADRCYLEKCRDYLFREFEICGLAGRAPGAQTKYPTVESLLSNTPDFNRHLWEDRLDGYFGSVHRYMEKHFGGRNPYVEQIQRHLTLIARLGKKSQFHKLSKRPQCVDAPALRRLLGIPATPRGHAKRHPRNAGATLGQAVTAA
ncbi:MAG: hypothetical protein K0Q76_843 [Panacagrimonas sp.]|jgi:hypothetical protein|nr:hypothetical protein [Panacagrimonas sp.]MCC2655735.1 hypothetical protein [Panacagrimonas sp.]